MVHENVNFSNQTYETRSSKLADENAKCEMLLLVELSFLAIFFHWKMSSDDELSSNTYLILSLCDVE